MHAIKYRASFHSFLESVNEANLVDMTFSRFLQLSQEQIYKIFKFISDTEAFRMTETMFIHRLDILLYHEVPFNVLRNHVRLLNRVYNFGAIDNFALAFKIIDAMNLPESSFAEVSHGPTFFFMTHFDGFDEDDSASLFETNFSFQGVAPVTGVVSPDFIRV